MRKTFQLRPEGKNPDRVLDATKHEIRKYFKRERGRALPAGVDYWDFECRFGPSQEAAIPARAGELIALVGALAQEGATQCYVEILARHGQRQAPPPKDGDVPEPPTAAPYTGDKEGKEGAAAGR